MKEQIESKICLVIINRLLENVAVIINGWSVIYPSGFYISGVNLCDLNGIETILTEPLSTI